MPEWLQLIRDSLADATATPAARFFVLKVRTAVLPVACPTHPSLRNSSHCQTNPHRQPTHPTTHPPAQALLHIEARRAAALEEASLTPTHDGASLVTAPTPPPTLFSRYADEFFPAITELLVNPGGSPGPGGGAGSPGPRGDGGGGPGAVAAAPGGGAVAAGPSAHAAAAGGAGGGVDRWREGLVPKVLHYVFRDVALTLLRWDKLFERVRGGEAVLGGAGDAVCGLWWFES
jgi:hypothetical protein